MILGFLFHEFLGKCNFLVPYLLFCMLFITFCTIDLKEMRFTMLNLWLLIIQTIGSIIVFLVLNQLDTVLAQGTMMCVLAPTATSTVVIGGLLGGNKTTIITHTLICNLVISIEAPIIFSLIGNSDTEFLSSFMEIILKIIPLLVGPLILALVIHLISPKIQTKIMKMQNLSFYLWAMALTIVIGRTINFIHQQDQVNTLIIILLALISLFICLLQFALGRYIGRKYNDVISGGQLLGQKNTALAIWLTQSYLNPIASIAPAVYAIWQNVINSYQLWKKKKNESKI